MKPLFLLLAALLPFSVASAQAPVTDDCIIRNFESDITLNRDSTLNITEDLLVDCGDLPDKHGIFRILPTKAPRPSALYNRTPVTLLSITDFSGRPYNYETIGGKNTVTWKIGDPDVAIYGLNEYRIKYHVENAVYPGQPSGTEIYYYGNEDVFHWNLNGNFWELEIEEYAAIIHLPEGISKHSSTTGLFSGELGAMVNTFAKQEWIDDQTIKVTSTTPLAQRQGITLVASFPQGIVTRYRPNFLELYGGYLWYLPLLGLLLIAYNLWLKYGRDPKLKAPDVVQYAPPKNLRPLELGLLDSFGGMKNQYLSATIVDLAVRGFLKIEELPQEGLLKKKNWQLTRLGLVTKDLKSFEKTLLDKLFAGKETTKLSEHKNEFYQYISEISEKAKEGLEKEQVFDPSAKSGWMYLVLLAAAEIALYFLVAGILLFGTGSIEILPHGLIAFLLSGLILVLFAILMPRRTLKGAQMKHELDGFKLYLSKTEKYRMEFYEKENIFEKYLPYAVAFGLVDKWVKAFRELMGDERTSHYAPAWYASTSSQAFAIDSFTSEMNSLASDISSSLGSSPSSSGGGGSGGGGGGGGGGSW